jgi:hypothetical protein
MLIQGQFIRLITIFIKGFGKPVGKVFDNIFYGFTLSVTKKRSPAAARIIGDGQAEPFILSPGPQGGLSQTGVTYDGNPVRVNLFSLCQYIHGPAQSPGPGRDGSPLSRFSFTQTVNTVVKTIMKIRINLTAVNGGQGITALKDSCYGPAGGSTTAMNRGALLVFCSVLSGNINIRIRKDGIDYP